MSMSKQTTQNQEFMLQVVITDELIMVVLKKKYINLEIVEIINKCRYLHVHMTGIPAGCS